MTKMFSVLSLALVLTASTALAGEKVDPVAGDEKNVEELAKPETAPESPELAALIDGISRFYNGIEHIDMKFRQVVQRKTKRRTKKASGTIEFTRPGKMRWEYKRPERVTYVADGKTLWAWQPEDGLVYRSKIEGSRLYHALRFLFGVGDLRGSFIPTLGSSADPATARLVLHPKRGKQDYKELTLVVDRKSFEIRESFLTDPMDNVTHYLFTEQDYEKPIPAERFEFTPPAGSTVQDI